MGVNGSTTGIDTGTVGDVRACAATVAELRRLERALDESGVGLARRARIAEADFSGVSADEFRDSCLVLRADVATAGSSVAGFRSALATYATRMAEVEQVLGRVRRTARDLGLPVAGAVVSAPAGDGARTAYLRLAAVAADARAVEAHAHTDLIAAIEVVDPSGPFGLGAGDGTTVSGLDRALPVLPPLPEWPPPETAWPEVDRGRGGDGRGGDVNRGGNGDGRGGDGRGGDARGGDARGGDGDRRTDPDRDGTDGAPDGVRSIDDPGDRTTTVRLSGSPLDVVLRAEPLHDLRFDDVRFDDVRFDDVRFHSVPVGPPPATPATPAAPGCGPADGVLR